MGTSYAHKVRGALAEQRLDQTIVAPYLDMNQGMLSRRLTGKDSGFIVLEAAQMAMLLARNDLSPPLEEVSFDEEAALRGMVTKAAQQGFDMLTPDDLRQLANVLGIMLTGIRGENSRIQQVARILKNLSEAPDPRTSTPVC